MSPTWRRPAAAAALMAVLVTGCSGNGDAPTRSDARTDSTASSAASVPSSTPSALPTTSTPPAGEPAADGIAKLPATKIFAKAKSLGLAAQSVRVRGSARDKSGEKVDFDVRMTKAGSQGAFTVSGATMGSRVIGKAAYLQLGEAMLRRMAKRDKLSAEETNAVATLLKDKWIKLSQQSDTDFALVLSMTTSHDKFFTSVLVPEGKLRKLPQRTIDGIAAIGLNDGAGTLWVDKRTGRPVRLDAGADGKDSFRFSDYDKLKSPAVPAASETVDGKPLGF